MNAFQKQLIVNGRILMDLQPKAAESGCFGPRPPAPQKVSIEEFEQTGREVHNMAEYEEAMTNRPEPTPQPAEDRYHGPAFQSEPRLGKIPPFIGNDGKEVDVIYVDAESGDGKIRAAIDAGNGKQTVIVISAANFDMKEIEGLMAKKREILNMPPKVFLDEFSKKFK